MIIQNGQSRNLAICNGRKVAMLRGGQWIIKSLLSSAVRSQIYADIPNTALAAEVWKACNVYCKQHAASHSGLASTLASFVNNDPDLYCSLPITASAEALDAMPTRWLVGDGVAYIDLNIAMSSNYHYNGTFKIDEYVSGANANALFGYRDTIGIGSGIGCRHISYNASNFLQRLGGSGINSPAIVLHQDFDVDVTRSKTTINGTQNNANWINGQESGGNCYLFYLGAMSDIRVGKPKCKRFSIDNNGTYLRNGIPCHTTANGMLDLETLTFYANAAASGSFTIEKTNPQ